MKRMLIWIIVLGCLMLVSCDAGSNPIQTSAPSGTATGGGDSTPGVTTSEQPSTTTTYPTLYTRPEIAETHPNVVPVEPIEAFDTSVSAVYAVWEEHYYVKEDQTYYSVEMDSTLEAAIETMINRDFEYYMIALITPIEIGNQDVRFSVDYIYETVRLNWGYPTYSCQSEVSAFTHGMHRPWYACATDKQIPITTTGGKYIAVVGYDIFGCLEEPVDIETVGVHYIFPLTWELDMEHVANADAIAETNRPPFIGYAQTYYLFGYGDVYEELMKEG